ncbi:MAG: ABC transporter ATP-binding protein [Gemmatimonadetes bacterium]|nr:ABC transporter ATP-binding protein [Gemmatimonadota bacterium]
MTVAARPTPADAPAIGARGLTRTFGALTAVNALSFDVAPGELFGLVGPDGAGKTTTLRMLAGVLRPTGGDATVHGVSVARDPEGVKHHIAYMSQRFGLYTDLTVRENLDFYADLYQVPKRERAARIERLYQFSNLGPFEHRLAGQLSGGMKQKLGLCCALVHQPEILLLDEPTFGVDPISRRDLWLILEEMVSQGVAVLVTTAYMDEAELCDHVGLLDKGRLLALDTPTKLMDSMFGQLMVLRATDPRRAVELLQRHPAVRKAALFGDVVHVVLRRKGRGKEREPGRGRQSGREWREIEASVTTQGIGVSDVTEIEASLEDVFIDRLEPDGGAA